MLSESRSFDDSLHQLDEALRQEPLPAGLDAKVLAAMQQARGATPASAGSWAPLSWAAAGVALVLGCVGAWLFLGLGQPKQLRVGGFVVLQGQARLSDEQPNHKGLRAGVWCVSPTCRLLDPRRQVVIDLAHKARIVRQPHQLRFLRGVATMRVKVSNAVRPVLVGVSHGVVKAHASRFALVQGVRSGAVTLEHGQVRFHHKDGPAQQLVVGRRVTWPWRPPPRVRPRVRPRVAPRPVIRPRVRRRPQVKRRYRPRPRRRRVVRRRPLVRRPVVPPTRAQTPPRVVPPLRRVPLRPVAPFVAPQRRLLPPKRMLARCLQESSQLRVRGRFSQAKVHLRQCLSRLARADQTKYLVTRESIHYELGLLLTYHPPKPKQACHHWRQHRRFFPSSTRYRAEVARILRRRKCP